MSEIQLVLPNGKKVNFPKYTTYYDISKHFKMKTDVLGVMVNNQITSLNDRADHNATIKFLDINDQNGNRIYVAGLKMVFEYALKKVLPQASVKFSYSLPKGIIADVEYNKEITNEIIGYIRKSMSTVVTDDILIEKLIVKNADGIVYYEEIGNVVKAENIKNIIDGTVMLYRLDDLINYYYSEMPRSTGVIKKYELRYLGHKRFVLNYPTYSDDGKTPEFINYAGVIDAYVEGKKWLNTMNIPYINDVNREICNGKIANFVKSCELNFNLSINETAKYISKNPKIKYVTISGPSTSGKTTVIKRIANYFEIYGLDPIIISIDDYFKERVDTPKDEKGEYDFECLQAIDLDYLAKDIDKLLKGEEIYLPQFNFITGCKEVSSRKIKMKDNSILLFEGLHGINDDLLPMLPRNEKYKIYVSPYIPLCLDEHNFITCEDLRLIRRIVRDFRTRGFPVEKTLKSNIKVRAGEIKYINPYIHQADKIINTSLPYEVGVLKVFVEPLLFAVPRDSEFFNEARRLLNFLKQFFTISSEFVPKDSILREFIGGDNDD
jgi:uridine kinase